VGGEAYSCNRVSPIQARRGRNTRISTSFQERQPGRPNPGQASHGEDLGRTGGWTVTRKPNLANRSASEDVGNNGRAKRVWI